VYVILTIVASLEKKSSKVKELIWFLTYIQDLAILPGAAEYNVPTELFQTSYLAPVYPGFLNKCFIYLSFS
jgi:hypothetical protein